MPLKLDLEVQAKEFKSSNNASANGMKFYTGYQPDNPSDSNTMMMYITNQGRIGIKNHYPQTELDVDGVVQARAFIGSSTGARPWDWYLNGALARANAADLLWPSDGGMPNNWTYVQGSDGDTKTVYWNAGEGSLPSDVVPTGCTDSHSYVSISIDNSTDEKDNFFVNNTVEFPGWTYANSFVDGSITYKNITDTTDASNGRPGLVLEIEQEPPSEPSNKSITYFGVPVNNVSGQWSQTPFRAYPKAGQEITQINFMFGFFGTTIIDAVGTAEDIGTGVDEADADHRGGIQGDPDTPIRKGPGKILFDSIDFTINHPSLRLDRTGGIAHSYISSINAISITTSTLDAAGKILLDGPNSRIVIRD